MKVLALTQYGRKGASSRLRVYQYLPSLEAAGIEVKVCPLLDDWYLDYLYARSPVSYPLRQLIQSYLQRIFNTFNVYDYDLAWIQREIFPWFPALVEKHVFKSKVPCIVDYDDAVFHRYDRHSNRVVRALLGRKIPNIMHNSSIVIAGNQYLRNVAVEAGARRVELLPTVVDVEKYQVSESLADEFNVGWIGTPGTVKYLKEIEGPLRSFLMKHHAKLVIVGASEAEADLNGLRIESLQWEESKEVEHVQSFDIGIMPLPNRPFEQGKCGYKLIQSLACGKPVIASPVGVNRDIVKPGLNGFLARTDADWLEALETLFSDVALRAEFGRAGRRMVEEEYNLEISAQKLVSLIESISMIKV